MFQQFIRPLYNGLIDLIYPRFCPLCLVPLSSSEPTDILCPNCTASQIHFNHPVFCVKCSRPVTVTKQIFCKQCQRHPVHFDRSWSAVIYNEPMRYLLHLLKYGNRMEMRHLFSRFIINFVEHYHVPVHDCDLIIPVPLHPARYRERGFNQSLLIALMLSKHFQIPCHPSLVTRARYTVNQARVNSKQRWTNMRDTFRIGRINTPINNNIIVIDDLLTTGATLSEVSCSLKNAGAKKVYGLTVAIAI